MKSGNAEKNSEHLRQRDLISVSSPKFRTAIYCLPGNKNIKAKSCAKKYSGQLFILFSSQKNFIYEGAKPSWHENHQRMSAKTDNKLLERQKTAFKKVLLCSINTS
jgi:hypothetical protein